MTEIVSQSTFIFLFSTQYLSISQETYWNSQELRDIFMTKNFLAFAERLARKDPQVDTSLKYWADISTQQAILTGIIEKPRNIETLAKDGKAKSVSAADWPRNKLKRKNIFISFYGPKIFSSSSSFRVHWEELRDI